MSPVTHGREGGARRVLLLTGGSRGIGAAIAAHAAQAGYAVCFTYATQRNRADETTRSLRAAGGEVLAIQADVADAEGVADVFSQAEAQLGPVTAVVNNAGVTSRIGPLHMTPLAQVRRVLDVNVLGTIAVCRHATKRWLERGTPGAVVNVSSVAAVTGSPNEYVAYAASKAAVETLTIGLAKEVAGRAIRVNAVSPGTIATEIHAASGDPDRPGRVAQRVPMGRVGEPDEIARAVLWLLSDEASYVTGSVLKVSGGL